MRYWILPLALAMIHAGVSEVEAQRQHKTIGECSIEADLVDLDGDWVTLRTSDGKLIDLPAAELSRADQRWVRDHTSTRKQTPHMPGQTRSPYRVLGRRDR